MGPCNFSAESCNLKDFTKQTASIRKQEASNVMVQLLKMG